MSDLLPIAKVSCGTCRACCKHDIIPIHPECGDNPADYETEQLGSITVLKRVDGHCVYLSDNGCTIWGRHPAICREFDCGRFFRNMTRYERRHMIRRGIASREVIDQGRRQAQARGL